METEKKNVTLDSVMEYLMKFKSEVTDNAKATKEETNHILRNLEGKLEDISKSNEGMERQIEETKNEVTKNKAENEKIFERMDKRMIDIEEAMRKSSLIRQQSDNLRQALVLHPEGRGHEKDKDIVNSKEKTNIEDKTEDRERRSEGEQMEETEVTDTVKTSQEEVTKIFHLIMGQGGVRSIEKTPRTKSQKEERK